MKKIGKLKDKLVRGAVILSVGSLVTKILGAIYRIPLTNLLGAEGIGIYQMVFPLYSLLLTISSTGVPSGISKIIANGKDSESTLKSSLCFFVPIGLIASILMVVFSERLAYIQGNIQAKYAYINIAFSLFAVTIISCFRGYFQGFSNMQPTAISQILEQLIKLVLGLILVYIFRSNVVLSASLATLAVTVSEFATCIYFIFLKYKRGGGFTSLIKAPIKISGILKVVFPVMLSTLIMPLSRTVESFFVINILNKYTENATGLYGLYSGAVESLVGVPVSICYGIAITSIPVISSLKSQGKNYNKKANQTILLTLIISLLCGVIFIALSPFAVNLLYRGLNFEDRLITIKMLKIASLSVITLPIMQTLTAILIAFDKVYFPSISALIACFIKILASVILLNKPQINIFALLYTDILCYLVACLIDLVYIIKDRFNFRSYKLQKERV